MASDNHASYSKIGFTVFAGVIAIAVALIYIAGIGDRSNQMLVETYYDYPVSGLSVGSAVNFRGVQVGEVREIQFVGSLYEGISSNDLQRIIIVMSLDIRKFSLKTNEELENLLRRFDAAGLRATISSNAVTGMSRIELSIVPNPYPPAEIAWKPRYYQIHPQPSFMESLSVSLARALNQFNKLDFASVWSNISSVASSTAKLTSEVSDLVSSEKDGISEIVRHVGEAARNIDEASSSVDELAETLKQNPSLLLRAADPEPLEETSK